jgi:DNA helicase-2/ATP-dependent DNA helicase PcrA
MHAHSNLAIIAGAGARKTQTIIDGALADTSRRTLITTYTNENLRQIEARIRAIAGAVPPHVRLRTWFSLLLNDGVRPYQSAVLDRVGVVKGLNVVSRRPLYAKKGTSAFYLDKGDRVYTTEAAAFACAADERSDGRVLRRLAAIFDQIFIDEMQDLVGYDLDFLDLLLQAPIALTMVGDPRQYILSTGTTTKNKKYRGKGMLAWLDARVTHCARQDSNDSYRCNQAICDFASALFPSLPAIHSATTAASPHEGIHLIETSQLTDYVERHKPHVLRRNKSTKTAGLPAMNIGLAKGSGYDHVLIFPTGPMRQYLSHRDPDQLKDPERLYVAVTRARHSVAFVI